MTTSNVYDQKRQMDALTTRNDISTCDLVDLSVDTLNNMVRD